MRGYPLYVKISFILLSIILFLYGLILAREFLYPLCFGILLAYLLYPFARYFEKVGIPRIIANIICILIAIVVIGLAFLFIYAQVERMIGDLPTLRQKAVRNVESLLGSFKELLDLEGDTIENFLKDNVKYLFDSSSVAFNNLFTATTGTLFKLGIMPVYIFLFLFYRTKFAYFFLKLTSEENKRNLIKILRDVSQVASKYMGGVFLVVAILCVINSTGLYIIGIQYAIALGVISAIFNFIPYFGTLLGGAVPVLFTLLVGDDPTDTIKVVVFFAFVQFTENNILTPNIVGHHVKINPFFIIIGLVASAMIWGIPGMLVIVPSLAILKIIFENIPKYQPLAFLLGMEGTSKHAFSLANIKRLYHKITRN